ncbi:glutamine synthetase [soil metagenome]
MRDDELVMFLYADLSGVCRGRAFAAADLQERLRTGVGWVPADQAVTPLGPIADPNPWGSTGDLRLLPDPDTRVRVDLRDDAAPLHFYLCDAVRTDGVPWDACVRDFLKRALDELDAEGLRLDAAFEQEFHLSDPAAQAAPGFSMEAFRGAEPFCSQLMRALALGEQEAETLLPEYGRSQFEVTVRPAPALPAADRAVMVREVVRDVARRVGRRATFTPIVDPADVGNGVHVHYSLRDLSGRQVTYDPERPAGVSATAASFTAGVLRHLPALCALTAPSVVSYQRLTPHRWSAAYVCWGERNREAAVRVAPFLEVAGSDPAASLNLEYRPADAAASPHLALGAIVRAGLEGLREGLEPPPLVDTDPSELSDDDRARLGVHRLPGSLREALGALAADEVVRSWFPPDLLGCYESMKRTEIDLLADVDVAEACERYRRVY